MGMVQLNDGLESSNNISLWRKHQMFLIPTNPLFPSVLQISGSVTREAERVGLLDSDTEAPSELNKCLLRKNMNKYMYET
jgi:hypothetical protein